MGRGDITVKLEISDGGYTTLEGCMTLQQLDREASDKKENIGQNIFHNFGNVHAMESYEIDATSHHHEMMYYWRQFMSSDAINVV